MTQIQIRRGTAIAWVTSNPILAQGELGYEIDTEKIKVGNGSDQWNDLNYFPVVWSALNDKPAVIASGATKEEARNSIDAAMLVNGKVPVSQLPSSLMQYQGVWDATTNTPTLVDGTGDPGDVYRVTTGGTRNLGSGSIDFTTGDYVIYNPSGVWEKSDTTDTVATVAGRTGNITLSVSDVENAVATTDPRLSDSRTPTVAGQVSDLCIVTFGSTTVRAVGTGDFPFGTVLQRAMAFSSVTYRCATADASGNLVVELRKNGTTVSGTSVTIAAGSQVSGGTATGNWVFAAGDILTIYITAVGTTPGRGLITDIRGLTA